MEVILLERIEKLGQMGDVVNVKSGYARNFLLPQKKALRSTAANKDLFAEQRVQLEAQNIERKKEAESVAGKVDGQFFIVLRQAGEAGQLYGSVTSRDIAELVSAGGVTIERRQVVLNNPLKVTGVHPVRISLHPEVSVEINLNIARTEEEAERQARGETPTGEATPEEEAVIAAEEVFETEDLAKAAEAELSTEDEADASSNSETKAKKADALSADESAKD